jgi:hypothetical protein
MAKKKFGWGGARPGAGRKPTGKAGVPHRVRPDVSSKHPVYVRAKLAKGIPSLRTKKAFALVLSAATEGKDLHGFRLVHFALDATHLHMIAEAVDRTALTRGVKGLSIRIARRLNKHFDRKGRLFGDRYSVRRLETPRDVRDTLEAILLEEGVVNPTSSAAYLDGWRTPVALPRAEPAPVVPPKTKLLRGEWRKHGLLG